MNQWRGFLNLLCINHIKYEELISDILAKWDWGKTSEGNFPKASQFLPPLLQMTKINPWLNLFQ